MKIKTKKEMTLPQLIEWGWNNIEKVEDKIFYSNTKDVFGRYSTVYFSVDGYGFNTAGVSHKDTFTVEIEEPITEDTVFKHMIEVRGSDHTTWNNTSIADEKLPNSTQFYAYIDEEYKLIWRDGKLVE